MPLISVLMPVYNAERFLGSAVKSILDQTYRDFEFLIVDDGSTDRSLHILRSFEAADRRVRLTSRDNTGYVIALNEMLHQAKGDYIARMDADDIADPERFSAQVKFLQAHPEVACVGSFVNFIDERGRFLRLEATAHESHDIEDRLLRGECPICHPAVMMRADAVRALGGYRAEFQPAEDRDLWLRLSETAELRNLPRPLLQYRLHSGSVSERNRECQIDNMRRACEEAWQRRGIDGQFTGPTDFRPTSQRSSRYEFHLRYGWWAFNSGERRTAMEYAATAVRLIPWRRDGWKLLAVSALKRPEQRRETPVALSSSSGEPSR